jgi:hypothetical protein
MLLQMDSHESIVTYDSFSSLKKAMYRDDILFRIFRFEGKDGEVEEFLEGENS